MSRDGGRFRVHLPFAFAVPIERAGVKMTKKQVIKLMREAADELDKYLADNRHLFTGTGENLTRRQIAKIGLSLGKIPKILKNLQIYCPNYVASIKEEYDKLEPHSNKIDSLLSRGHPQLAQLEYRKYVRTIYLLLSTLRERADDLAEEDSVDGTPKGQKSPNETSREVGKDKLSDDKELTWQAKVIALALDHRDWSVKKIADKVGRTRQALYKDKNIRDALKARSQQKRPDKSHLPHGEKDSKTGNIEAW